MIQINQVMKDTRNIVINMVKLIVKKENMGLISMLASLQVMRKMMTTQKVLMPPQAIRTIQKQAEEEGKRAKRKRRKERRKSVVAKKTKMGTC